MTQVYGLDIETGHAGGTVGERVDPRLAPVTRVAFSTPASDWTFTGDEPDLLGELDEVIADHRPGILVTWNGSGFVLPYLADRANIRGVRLGLRLAAEPRLRTRGETLVGHPSPYVAAWHGHRHLDAARLYRSGRRPLVEVTELLRSLGWHPRARHADGTGPADVPGGELTHAAVHAFPTNDARLLRNMIEMRLPGVGRHVDRITVPARRPQVRDRSGSQPTATGVATGRPPLSPAHPAVRASMLGGLITPGT